MRVAVVLLACAATACGARSAPFDLDVRGDASTVVDVGEDVPARACPPASRAWSTSSIAEGVAYYAIAADPICGATIVYTGDAQRLFAATLGEDGEWTRTPLDAHGFAIAATLEKSGDLHVLYNDGAALRHLSLRAGVALVDEQVDAAGLTEGEIGVAPSGEVHAAYVAKSDLRGEVRYATRGSKGWTSERFDARFASDVTLAFLADGSPIVAYQYVSNSEVHGCTLATKPAGAWSLVDLETLDGSRSSEPCNVRTTASGVVHLDYGAYFDVGFRLRDAFGRPGKLAFRDVVAASAFGFTVHGSALDSKEDVVFAYATDLASPVRATIVPVEPVGTTTEEIPESKGGGGVIVVVDGADVAHVVFARGGELVHAARAL